MASQLKEADPNSVVPIVDVSGLASSDLEDRRRVAMDIRKACLDKGFMYIVGHGVDPALQEAIMRESKRFFALPEDEKMKIDMKLSPCNRGYEPLRGQTLEPGAPPDVKESFYSGEDLSPDNERVKAGKFNQGPNQWPEGLPGFREVMETYYWEMRRLGERMMRGLALSLYLPENEFAEFCKDPISTLRLIHYPPQPANPSPDEKGCGAHTDFGGLTFLLQDDAGGLEVLDKEKGWVPAPPVPGSYVVNLGDMISRWTNDRYHSNMHRVVNVSGRDRYSIPFFFTGNPDCEVECLPVCLAPGERPFYPPTTVEGHLREMYARTYV